MKQRKKRLFWWMILGFIVFLTIISTPLSPFEPNEMDMDQIYAPPGVPHLLGTDHLGRDVFSRLLAGGKVTLSIAVGSVLLSFVIGLLYGGISGYFGGWVDVVMMRLLEAFLAIPTLIIILTFQVFMHGSLLHMILIIGLTGWFVTARIVRSEFIKLREAEFVKMAKMLGTPTWKIISGHLLRNSMHAVFIVTLFNFASAIFIEASLSFLGIGVPPSIPSWGNMLYYAQNDILIGAWWIGLFPGILIFLTVLAVNFIGESLKKSGRGQVDA